MGTDPSYAVDTTISFTLSAIATDLVGYAVA